MPPTAYQSRGPDPIRQQLARDTVRGQILSGDLAPGSRLPTRRDLCRDLSVSSITLQRALDELTRDGFIESRGAAGTFVVESPPHLTNYALVIPRYPNDPDYARFWTAMANEAARPFVENGTVRKIRVWQSIDGHADNEDFQQLCGEVRRRRVAGLIFATNPFLLNETPLLTEPNVPRVAVMSHLAGFPGVSQIELDADAFISRALDYLVSRGRRRIAIILPTNTQGLADRYRQRIADRGLETRDHWIHMVSPGHPQCARSLSHLLFNADQTTRPDGLVLADDNSVEDATAGLNLAGVSVPGDLDVVAHCNFPWPTPHVVPVKRLGYDANELLRTAIGLLERQRRNQMQPGMALLQPKFEEEL